MWLPTRRGVSVGARLRGRGGTAFCRASLTRPGHAAAQFASAHRDAEIEHLPRDYSTRISEGSPARLARNIASASSRRASRLRDRATRIFSSCGALMESRGATQIIRRAAPNRPYRGGGATSVKLAPTRQCATAAILAILLGVGAVARPRRRAAAMSEATMAAILGPIAVIIALRCSLSAPAEEQGLVAAASLLPSPAVRNGMYR